MITRRGFFGLLGGALAAEAARKIYVLPPLGGWKCAGGVIMPGEALYFFDGNQWSFRYVYRNSITGHVSDVVPWISDLRHTFAYPEHDVVDIYKQLSDGSFHYDGPMSAWEIKG
jgi:hypothetical protein